MPDCASFGPVASFLGAFLSNFDLLPDKPPIQLRAFHAIGHLVPYRDTVSLSFFDTSRDNAPWYWPRTDPDESSPAGALFCGRWDSLRGWALNQAGPPTPARAFQFGGQALLLLNRNSVSRCTFLFFGSLLGVAIFYDGETWYRPLRPISFRVDAAAAPLPLAKFRPLPAAPTTCPCAQRLQELTQLLRSHRRFGREV